MGIYFFNTDILIQALEGSNDDDFGGEVIPRAIHSHRVYGFDFDDYWEDIGTIRSFYDTNLSLANPDPLFDFNSPNQPIYSHPRFLPCTVVNGASLHHVLLADGSNIGNAEIKNTIIGLRSQIQDNTKISNTILMGADYFDSADEATSAEIPLGIGSNCHIEGALIDKNARIGRDVTILPFPREVNFDNDYYFVRDGIVVIPKNTIIPSGTVIKPE